MPEIAEVARIVHFLRLKLVGKTISSAVALDDNNVFGKVGTSGKEVEAALRGRKVVAAGSQGKYFWITLDKPPHLIMHFGMTGWVHIKGERTAYTNYYKKMKASDIEQWPPKFWKFHFSTSSNPPVEVAFVDARRFGRVRLAHVQGDEIRSYPVLAGNGPDPVVDKDRFTEEYLRSCMTSRRVPVKALLLDQTVISGIGNWVADETLYHAGLHPEQYCHTFSDAQIRTLHEMIRMVCQTAVDKLGESDEFPDHWLFNHRWGKGNQGAASVLPNGEKIAFITVGGRTSCYAPNVQKKTGQVPEGIKVESVKLEPDDDEGISSEKSKPAPKKSRKRAAAVEADAPPRKRARTKSAAVKEEERSPSLKVSKEVAEVSGRRRSSRLRP